MGKQLAFDPTWMCSLAASPDPANHTVSLDAATAAPTTATSGPSLPVLLASYGPAGWLRRTSQGFCQLRLDGSLDEFLETWPRAGTMRSGIVFQHSPLAPLTAEIASGSWPTPTVNDAKNNAGPSQYTGGGRNSNALNVAVAIWSTPTRRDAETLAKVKRGKGSTSRGQQKIVPLGEQAARRIWPTPTGGDATGSGCRNSATSKAHPGISLTDAALTGESSTPRAVVPGVLSPNFVEWLMGYPRDWTRIVASGPKNGRTRPASPRTRRTATSGSAPSGTPSSRPSSHGSGTASLPPNERTDEPDRSV